MPHPLIHILFAGLCDECYASHHCTCTGRRGHSSGKRTLSTADLAYEEAAKRVAAAASNGAL